MQEANNDFLNDKKQSEVDLMPEERGLSYSHLKTLTHFKHHHSWMYLKVPHKNEKLIGKYLT